jgi:hypothetical protein
MRSYRVLQLQIIHLVEYFAEPGAGLETERNQVAAGDERVWLDFVDFEFAALLNKKVDIPQVAVAGKTIGAVKRQFIVEGGPGQETLECRHSHFFDVHEVHVVVDAGSHGIDQVVRRPEPAQNSLRHLCTHAVMVVEPDAVRRRLRCRLADIVQQSAPGENLRRVVEVREGQERMAENIALRMKLRRLLNALKGRDLGQDACQEP